MVTKSVSQSQGHSECCREMFKIDFHGFKFSIPSHLRPRPYFTMSHIIDCLYVLKTTACYLKFIFPGFQEIDFLLASSKKHLSKLILLEVDLRKTLCQFIGNAKIQKDGYL